MEDIKVLLASDEETLVRCCKVREKVFTIEKGISKDIEVDEHDCICDKYDHFVVVYKNVDVCAFRCFKSDEHRVKLQRFCVLKDYRKLGIGKYALEYMEEFYAKCNIKSIELDAKCNAMEFYIKCGYIVVSEKFIEADVEHVKMVKKN